MKSPVKASNNWLVGIYLQIEMTQTVLAEKYSDNKRVVPHSHTDITQLWTSSWTESERVVCTFMRHIVVNKEGKSNAKREFSCV